MWRSIHPACLPACQTPWRPWWGRLWRTSRLMTSVLLHIWTQLTHLKQRYRMYALNIHWVPLLFTECCRITPCRVHLIVCLVLRWLMGCCIPSVLEALPLTQCPSLLLLVPCPHTVCNPQLMQLVEVGWVQHNNKTVPSSPFPPLPHSPIPPSPFPSPSLLHLCV